MTMEAVVMKYLVLIVSLVIVMNGIGKVVTDDDDSQPQSCDCDDDYYETDQPCNGKCSPCVESPACQKGFQMLVSGKCYMFSIITRTWQDALEVCQSAGATLAYPMNAEENTVLATYLSAHFDKFSGWWLDGNDLGKVFQFRWAHNNASITYFDWAARQPDNFFGNERCLQYYKDNWQWDDGNCAAALPFICQQL